MSIEFSAKYISLPWYIKGILQDKKQTEFIKTSKFYLHLI